MSGNIFCAKIRWGICYLHLWLEDRDGGKNRCKGQPFNTKNYPLRPPSFLSLWPLFILTRFETFFTFCETRNATNTVSFLDFSCAVVGGLLGTPSQP